MDAKYILGGKSDGRIKMVKTQKIKYMNNKKFERLRSKVFFTLDFIDMQYLLLKCSQCWLLGPWIRKSCCWLSQLPQWLSSLASLWKALMHVSAGRSLLLHSYKQKGHTKWKESQLILSFIYFIYYYGIFPNSLFFSDSFLTLWNSNQNLCQQVIPHWMKLLFLKLQWDAILN